MKSVKSLLRMMMGGIQDSDLERSNVVLSSFIPWHVSSLKESTN